MFPRRDRPLTGQRQRATPGSGVCGLDCAHWPLRTTDEDTHIASVQIEMMIYHRRLPLDLADDVVVTVFFVGGALRAKLEVLADDRIFR